MAPTQTGDRIVMPSIRKDGEWDQTDPVIVGDLKFAKAAAGEQAAQRAVSLVDQAVRTNPREAPEFTSIEDLAKQHEAAAESARTSAEAKVEALHEPAPTEPAVPAEAPAAPAAPRRTAER